PDIRLDPGGRQPPAPHDRVLKPPRPELPRPELPRPELPRPELPRPELPRPELPRPELPRPELPRPELPTPELAGEQSLKPLLYLCINKGVWKLAPIPGWLMYLSYESESGIFASLHP